MTPIVVPEHSDLAELFFGRRWRDDGLAPEAGQQYGTLYEAVPVACRIDPASGRFQAAVMVPSMYTDFSWDPHGRVFEGGADRESVLVVFAELDGYVRLLLPDEYLARFEGAGPVWPSFGRQQDPGEPLLLPELYDFVAEFFGPRLSFQSWGKEQRAVGIRGVLYDAVPLWCGLEYDSQRGKIDLREAHLGATVRVNPFGGWASAPGGERKLMANGREWARFYLTQVDEFVRLSLPGKYVAAFNDAHGITGTAGAVS